MTFWVDWYLYQAFMINIKGARKKISEKLGIICSVQMHWFTTYY